MAKSVGFPCVKSKGFYLLQAIAISGELPITQAKRLIGGGRYYEKVITRLKADGYITAYGKSGLYGYRLTRAAKDRLVSTRPGRFEYFLSGNTATNHVRSEYPQRLRCHSMSEVNVTMLKGGVSIFLDEKPDVFYPFDGEALDLPDITEPLFFSSREVKDMGIDATGIQGSRSMGLLLTPGDLFITYNAAGGSLKMDYKPEMRLKALVRTTLCGDRLSHQYTPDNIRGLFFGDSMELAARLLGESQGKTRNYFIFDGGYDHFHFLTNDDRGEVILKILCNPKLHDMLHQVLSIGLLARNPGSVFENDATDSGGHPVLFAFDCDLPRISRFNRSMLTHEGIGTLICFDFQADALRRFCSDSMVFQTIDFVKFVGRYVC